MSDQTNLLLILTDDQGYWTMGCSGNSEIKTPNLDRLAETGLRFVNFFCASPVCSPARASILTGQIPSHHGVQDFLRGGNTSLYKGEASGSPMFVQDDKAIEYLAGLTGYSDLLSQAGYNCGLSGKWHLGASENPQMSFEFWDVHAFGAGPYYKPAMIRDGKPYESTVYASDLFTDNALAFLEAQKNSDQPFCLNVHHTAPHAPWGREQHPAELFNHYYENCPFESTPNVPIHSNHVATRSDSAVISKFDEEWRRDTLSGYFAAMTAMDANVGRLLDWLEENGERENTLVIFTSDNGMNMGHHGIYGKGNSTFPVNMYDTSVKVPTLISQPGRVPEAKVISTLHSHYDLMPTLLEHLGVENPDAETLPGKSFAALLSAQNLDGDDHVVVYDEYGPTRMIRSTGWKYVHRYPFGPHELYDIANDPDEQNNLKDDKKYQNIQEELRGNLDAFFVCYADPQRDGAREDVTGRGQLDIVGPAAKGRKRFAQDVLTEEKRVKGKERHKL